MLSCRVSCLVKRCAAEKNLIRKLEVEREGMKPSLSSVNSQGYEEYYGGNAPRRRCCSGAQTPGGVSAQQYNSCCYYYRIYQPSK